jgi:hypothetical protein
MQSLQMMPNDPACDVDIGVEATRGLASKTGGAPLAATFDHTVTPSPKLSNVLSVMKPPVPCAFGRHLGLQGPKTNNLVWGVERPAIWHWHPVCTLRSCREEARESHRPCCPSPRPWAAPAQMPPPWRCWRGW